MAVHDVKVLVSSPEYIPSDAVLTENDEIAGPEDKKGKNWCIFFLQFFNFFQKKI